MTTSLFVTRLVPLLALAVGLASPLQASATSDYVLQASDLLRIVVFQEPDLYREVRISQENTINLPLIGSIDLAGKTVRQAEELIRELYDRDYLKNPQITITVAEYTPRTVQVMGAVNQPGSIAFTPEQNMTFLEAIARAGGFNRIADRKRVRLTRTLPDGRAENVIINADDLIQGSSTERWQLQKGDVIFVNERVI